MKKLPRHNNKYRNYDRNYANTILARTISSNLIFKKRTFFNVNFRGARLRRMKLVLELTDIRKQPTKYVMKIENERDIG